MPTPHSHTHCQVVPADTQAKTWQRVCLSNRTTDKQTDEEKEALGGNRRLAQWRVTWLIEHSTSHQLLWCIDSFVLRNPPLRQAPKRCGSCFMKRLCLIIFVWTTSTLTNAQTMLEILKLIPKENLGEINIDSLIKNKEFYPIDNSEEEAVKYSLTNVNDTIGTLRIEMNFETGQRGFTIRELKKVKVKNNEFLVVYSLVTGAPITFGQSELKMYRLRKEHLEADNENLLPIDIGLVDFLRPGTPDSIIKKYSEYSNHSYGLTNHGNNISYVLYQNFESYGIDKSWLLGDKIEFIF